MGDYFAEYQAYGQEFRDALSFRDFVQLQRDSRPRDHIGDTGIIMMETLSV